MQGAAQQPTARESGSSLALLLELNRDAIADLEAFLRKQVGSFEPEVQELAAYCLENSGKRLRPLLVFLSGWAGEGKVNPDLVKTAAVIEMVHMATLVHDDIMDGAAIRRGRATVSEKDGPSVAVLLGDALFAQAVVLSTEFPDTRVCRRVAEATRRVCSGEILQTLGGQGSPTNRERYERIIDLKTAELFSASCELGAALLGKNKAGVEAAARFGRHLGVAYQIYDDLADFAGDADAIGKTLGTDWLSGKLTLPLLELLERSPTKDSAETLEAIRSGDSGKLAHVTRRMRELGVFDSVLDRIRRELGEARSALASNGHAPGQVSLLDLADALEQQAVLLHGSRPDISS